MALLTTATVASDWLKYEADSEFSREQIIIASGSGKLPSGQVLAQLTASLKYVPVAAAGSDGSQTATAVLVFPVDATSADVPKAVAVARHAIASHNGLTWGPTVNDATKRAAAIAQLKTRGILVREGA